MDIKTCQSLIKMHRCSTQFLIYFILFLFSQGKIDFTKNRISFHLIEFLGCYAQLCLEDGAVNEKLRDQRFIQRQLDCILAEHDQHCDQFGAQLKSKIPCLTRKKMFDNYFLGMAPEVFRGTCVKPCTKCTQKQIRKVIVVLQRKYPKEFSLIVRRYSQNRG